MGQPLFENKEKLRSHSSNDLIMSDIGADGRDLTAAFDMLDSHNLRQDNLSEA